MRAANFAALTFGSILVLSGVVDAPAQSAPQSEKGKRHVPLPSKEPSDVRVLSFAKLPVVIDKRGVYILLQDWDVESPYPAEPSLKITANNVTIDLRGHRFADFQEGSRVDIAGENVIVRNGRMEFLNGGFMSTGFGTRVEDIDFHSDFVSLSGENSLMRHSKYTGHSGVRVSGSVVEYNEFTCQDTHFCMRLSDGSQALWNRIRGEPNDVPFDLIGELNVVANNVATFEGARGGVLYRVEGNQNVVRNNTVLWDGQESVVGFEVRGSRNVFDGNIVAGSGEMEIGISFMADGNFFGNNRLSATVPIALNGTVQTDWGGNVGL